MAAKARKKYVCKNIGEYKRLRRCTHAGCAEYGIVSYRNDPVHAGGGVKVEFRCINHVHKERELQVVVDARKPYTTLVDYAAILAIDHSRVR